MDRRTGYPATQEGDPEDILDLERLANDYAVVIVVGSAFYALGLCFDAVRIILDPMVALVSCTG